MRYVIIVAAIKVKTRMRVAGLYSVLFWFSFWVVQRLASSRCLGMFFVFEHFFYSGAIGIL
jgi:hypothetical protein